ncbi:MAG: sugar kinase [Verrucomicrobia bacterium]|nr:MAG: sugar kinase [Verrucomicrobiota bacterium]
MHTKPGQPVLVVGSVAFDQITTPTAESGRVLGGSATYASIAASYLAPVNLVGVVGNDFGESHFNRLRAHPIDLEGLQTDPSGPTFFWSGIYGENFATRETTDTQLNVFEHFNPTLPEPYRGTPYVLLGNIHPELQHRVLDQINGKPFVAADTMNLWIDISLDELNRLLPRLDLFVLNDDESKMLTDESNVILAGKRLMGMGPDIVVIKKGEHGSILFHKDGLFSFPAYPVTQVKDPTGAGDSYLGALVGSLASRDSINFPALKRAIVYATATASLTVESFSCDRLEQAGREAIEGRYQELLQLASVN